MIASIQGDLVDVQGGAVLLRVEGWTYEVLTPAYCQARLAGKVGETVSLQTLHFLESQSQGAVMIPRLAGFLSLLDRRFFELFTTCKGIGYRKALRAMALDTAQIAAAIADRDAATLQSLPEIGRRTAETVIATLNGKVDPFLTAAAFDQGGDGAAGDADGAGAEAPSTSLAREALEVLLTLGENRIQATNWVNQALQEKGDPPRSAEEIVARVYRIKAGA